MVNAQILLDPTAETSPVVQSRIARVPSLEGRTIGLLDIAKPRADEFLDRIDEVLRERGFTVKRYRKRAFMERASTELKQQIRRECDAVIEALAD
jgi:acetolactate synthase regulatory subunit